jgi:ketosteroid isomerase-like protein
VNRADAIDLLDRLHATQNRCYAGGSPDRLVEILAADIVWTVPGDNSIAETYHGRDQVFEYFRRRRDPGRRDVSDAATRRARGRR